MFFFFFFFFFVLELWHMEFLSLGIQSELKLPAHTTASATPDPSHVCNEHCSSQHHWIFNPLSEAMDQTHIFMDTSRVRYSWATTGTPSLRRKSKSYYRTQEELMTLFRPLRAGELCLTWGRASEPFFLFRPSNDWVEPTHIMERNPLYSLYPFKC